MTCPEYESARIELFEIASTKIVNMLNYSAGDQFILLLKYCQKYVSNFLNQAYDIRKTKIYTSLRGNRPCAGGSTTSCGPGSET